MLRMQIIAATVSISIIIIVFELIRRRRLKEEYSLLWLLSGFIILVLGIFPNILDTISKALGVYYLTALLFMTFLFLLMIVLHFSTVISKLSERNKDLAQEVSILGFKLKELQEKFTAKNGNND